MSDELTTSLVADIRADTRAKHEADLKDNEALRGRICWAPLPTQNVVVPEWDGVTVQVCAFEDHDLDGYDLDRLTSEDRDALLGEVLRNPANGLLLRSDPKASPTFVHMPAGVVRRLFNLALRLSGFDAT